MQVLVTGGCGFTGAALVLRLLEDGHRVRALDNKPGIREAQLRKAGAEILFGSITDPDLMRKATEGCAVVFHLAAAFRDMGSPNQVYRDVNRDGTRIVMESAKSAGVTKVVYCSTQGVHGHIEPSPGDENSPIAPEDYYQETKYMGEGVVREYIQQGMKVTIIRPTAIFGPGDPARFVMIFRRVWRGSFPMFGRGYTCYHPLYIDNLSDAFVLAMDRKVCIRHYPFWPLLIASHVCEKLCKPFGIAPPIFPRRADWYRQNRAFRIDKARRDLGYDPRVDLDTGLQRTFAWYRDNGYLQ
ncbi:MAG: NAD(P)-dependent oxidoreductase [Verrucomicrobia bacterium]|nr:NAD(P)-dependent oxidoreductase [Verrucomicrobiota bacterium]